MTDERRMRGRVYVRIDKGEVREGDVVDFVFDGSRTRRVEAVHMGCSARWVKVEALVVDGVTVDRGRRVALQDVTSAWRRRTEVEKA